MASTDPRSKRTLRRNSNSHGSMSDNESTTSQADSFHSPRWDSPFRSDDPYFQSESDNLGNKSSKSLVSFDRTYSPSPSPGKLNLQASSPAAAGAKGWRPWPRSEKHVSENSEPPPIDRREREKSGLENQKGRSNQQAALGFSRLVKDEPVKKLGAVCVGGGGGGLEEGYDGGRVADASGEREEAVENILRRSERTAAVRKAALLFRVFEMIVCLISFSVMAADKTQGWSGDSFDRYIEYRYCLAVNIIGFGYSGFQVFNLAYYLGTEKHLISHHLRYHFDFLMDQILAYLLISASSSAATRVTDWISNWGKDMFTLMASASISMSFLAFVAFAFSSLISGYNLGNQDSS